MVSDRAKMMRNGKREREERGDGGVKGRFAGVNSVYDSLHIMVVRC